MGEMVDMILDGTLCEVCGVFMDDGLEYPHKCPSCQKEAEEDEGTDDNND